MKNISDSSRQNLREAYIQLAKPKPDFRLPDYKTYLKYRKLLKHYSFCSNLFEDLLNLSLASLNHNGKANRKLLLEQTIQHLFSLDQNHSSGRMWVYKMNGKPNPESIDKLFLLGDFIIKGENPFITHEIQKRLSWRILKCLAQFHWKPSHFDRLKDWIPFNEEAVKTILESPQNIELTNDWIIEHENHPIVAPYRMFHIARMLDCDAKYAIRFETLLGDCEVLNKTDQDHIDDILRQERAIQKQDELRSKDGKPYVFISGREMDEFSDLISHEFDSFVEKQSPFEPNQSNIFPYSNSQLEEVERTYEYRYWNEGYTFRTYHKRPYPMPLKFLEGERILVPDFEAATAELKSRPNYYIAKSMMWGAALSSLSDKKKKKIIWNWNSEETITSLIHIAKRLNKADWIK